MPFSRTRRRFAAWLALIAMVLDALAPAVAQAVVASSDRAQWVEVCSASGMIWIQPDADATAAGSSSVPGVGAAMSCPWCTLHGGAADLPPAMVLSAPLPRLTEPPPVFFRAVTLTGIWVVAQARDPPLSV